MVPLACGLPVLLGKGVAEGRALDCQNDGRSHDDRVHWT